MGKDVIRVNYKETFSTQVLLRLKIIATSPGTYQGKEIEVVMLITRSKIET